MRVACAIFGALVAFAVVPSASAARRTSGNHGAPARAPAGPPLTSGGISSEDEQTAGIPSAAGDQLVENGLSSPLCDGALGGGLSGAARRDCRGSGFVGAQAPTNDYALDVHIDTGAFGFSKGGLLSVVQDVFIAPLWGAIEWLVHALVVLLEWCYTLELLGGSSTSAAASALARARDGFTEPWLALALAVASLLALHRGIVHRRVADTLGGALTMLAMMAGGLWVIADPQGTVGVVGSWADQASLGTLAATAGGSPSGAAATLAEGMRGLYQAAIEVPWCYLEFGNVRWCSDPASLEGRLRTAAVALAARDARAGAPSTATAPIPADASAPTATSSTAELVREASTNGALFLAFPANGPERNSINEEGSLLHVICQSEDATKCSGPAAAEAQFRTDGGTFPRLLGLLAIAVGVLGMALLFGAIALRLLAAAFVGLLLLLLAPFAVLAPALGDGGRAVFAGWASRLLGAAVSKLLFSFVLGALLTMQRMLVALELPGWWTQWLLLSAFWWIVFLERHQMAGALQVRGRVGSDRRASAVPAAAAGIDRATASWRSPAMGGQVERSLQIYGAVRHPRLWARAQVNRRIAPLPPPGEEKLGAPKSKSPPALERTPAPLDLTPERNGPGAATSDGPPAEPPPPQRRAHGGLDDARGGASHPEDSRFSSVGELVRRRRDAAYATLGGHPRGHAGGWAGKGGTSSAPRSLESWSRVRARPERGQGDSHGERDPGERHRPMAGDSPSGPGRPQAPADTRVRWPPLDCWGPAAPSRGTPSAQAGEVRSPIMEDARAVAERRKRQLGFGSSQ